jgi:diketogulonate reductase-like aldo/keto reductase
VLTDSARAYCVHAGTMTMGQQNGAASSLRILDTASDAGVNFFDSAEMYALICPLFPSFSKKLLGFSFGANL